MNMLKSFSKFILPALCILGIIKLHTDSQILKWLDVRLEKNDFADIMKRKLAEITYSPKDQNDSLKDDVITQSIYTVNPKLNKKELSLTYTFLDDQSLTEKNPRKGKIITNKRHNVQTESSQLDISKKNDENRSFDSMMKSIDSKANETSGYVVHEKEKNKEQEHLLAKKKEQTTGKNKPSIKMDVNNKVHEGDGTAVPSLNNSRSYIPGWNTLISSRDFIIKSLKNKFRGNNPNKARSQAVNHAIDKNEISLSVDERQEVRKEIYRINAEEKVRNMDKFGHLRNDDIIIVIQTHNRLKNLKLLVTSLTLARNVSSAVVIFSHDYYDESINTFIRSITAFRTLQMFFPLAIQLFPDKFPGRDPRDCKWNTVIPKRNESDPLTCLNELWPDKYGHYREAAFTQIKHHWWWKLHRIFRGLKLTENFTGDVLFLEEDHLVTPDLFHMIRLLQEAKPTLCPDCTVLGLGNFNKKFLAGFSHLVTSGTWQVNKYNLGFTLNRNTFKIISDCAEAFCIFDDYNWDWSVFHLVNGCAKDKLKMLTLKIPRVVHLGVCGTHVQKSECNLSKEQKKLGVYLKKITLYPPELNMIPSRVKIKPQKPNGGWGDLRDRKLCEAIANISP